jgi:hypothetical protein
MDIRSVHNRTHVAALLALAVLFVLAPGRLVGEARAAEPSQEFFDDFSYTGTGDPNFKTSAWRARNMNPEFPGPPGAQWKASNVRFSKDPSDSSNTLMTLASTSAGPAANPTQSEVSTTARFYQGTYAARVMFTNAATNGAAADQPVEAFYAVNAPRYENDPLYSECDFEYLGNGGWNLSGPRLWVMTWESFSLVPWVVNRAADNFAQDYSGWHTLLYQVSGGNVSYYIDGTFLATHSGTYYPEGNMSIAFENWFVIATGIGASTSPREYDMDVDWAYYGKNAVLSTDDVSDIVANLRAAGVARKDTTPSVALPAKGRIAWYSYTSYGSLDGTL